MSPSDSPSFDRCIGIDYSGAKTPTSSLKGLRIFGAGRDSEPVEVLPPPSPRKYWARRGVAEWLVDEFQGRERALVGIDRGPPNPTKWTSTNGCDPADMGGAEPTRAKTGAVLPPFITSFDHGGLLQTG